MGAEGAVNVIHRRAVAAADDPEAARRELTEEYKEALMHPYYAAERGLVDDVIDPRTTRAVLAEALRVLRTKQEQLVPRKHGNPPM